MKTRLTHHLLAALLGAALTASAYAQTTAFKITVPKISGMFLAVLQLVIGFTVTLHAQSTAFTYQGQLTDNGGLANGIFDTAAELWDAPSGGAPVGTAITNVTLPLGRCTTNSCGNFDWMGNVTLTNGINPNETQRHFTVSVP
jgi:hypothetical protein